ncbi:DUF84 family protein, partial [Escherichia coli]|uniref:DUF84 family protein n=1 Tax=Escherichia coli TaxID=562 RepID=UPI00202EF02A
EQPFGSEETRAGARNREANARRLLPEADFWVAIEAGIDGDSTPGEKEKIQLCFEATLSEDPDLASQADVRFHLAIAEASHNIVLLQTMRGFFDVLQSSVKHSRQRMYLVPPVFSQLTEQHQAVIDAIFAGDADGA